MCYRLYSMLEYSDFILVNRNTLGRHRMSENSGVRLHKFHCIFDVQHLVLCLNRELIKILDYKFMLKLQCKTTFNSVFVGKKIIKIVDPRVFTRMWRMDGRTDGSVTTETCQKYSVTVIFHYVFHVKPHCQIFTA
jgi:hypothetical protein